MKKQIHIIRNGLRGFNRWAGVLKEDPYQIGLSLSQSSALVDIERFGSLKSQDLVRLLNLDKSSVSRIVSKLLTRKLIEVADDEKDKRAKILTLTASGKELVRKIHHISNQSVAEALKNLKDGEIMQLASAFENLTRAVENLDRYNQV